MENPRDTGRFQALGKSSLSGPFSMGLMDSAPPTRPTPGSSGVPVRVSGEQAKQPDSLRSFCMFL